MRDENQLHAAIVEIVVHDRAEVKYSTVQNWYPGDDQLGLLPWGERVFHMGIPHCGESSEKL